MKIQTTRFGEVEISDNQIISMPSGILGFSAEHHFVILEEEAGGPFEWFQSIETPGLAFVMIDPNFVASDYEFEVSDEQMKKIDAQVEEDISVRVLITIAREFKDTTVNLQGPILFNLKKRLGMQLVIPDGRYSTRQPLFGDRLSMPPEAEPAQGKDSENTRQQAIA
jgi:flagellar assembly factor FliW